MLNILKDKKLLRSLYDKYKNKTRLNLMNDDVHIMTSLFLLREGEC